MEHAIDRAAQVLVEWMPSLGHAEDAANAARALADAGLLAPGMRPTRTWRAVAPEGHIWCESSSEREVRRHARPGDILERLWATAVREEWRAEGDAMNRQNTVVLARDVSAAEAAGYPRHRWCVVTPRNIKIGPRGMQARYAVAVDLTDGELTEMLVHDSVAPAFLWAGDAEVVRVTAEGDGRADCHCAHCHQGPFAIMHICSDCGSKRCPRAAHHENRCAKASS